MKERHQENRKDVSARASISANGNLRAIMVTIRHRFQLIEHVRIGDFRNVFR
jgi:hypothetical protein